MILTDGWGGLRPQKLSKPVISSILIKVIFCVVVAYGDWCNHVSDYWRVANSDTERHRVLFLSYEELSQVGIAHRCIKSKLANHAETYSQSRKGLPIHHQIWLLTVWGRRLVQ